MMPSSMQPIWMTRASTCASGRNSSVEPPGAVKISGAPALALRTSASRLRWVSSQPLGRPVVPEV